MFWLTPLSPYREVAWTREPCVALRGVQEREQKICYATGQPRWNLCFSWRPEQQFSAPSVPVSWPHVKGVVAGFIHLSLLQHNPSVAVKVFYKCGWHPQSAAIKWKIILDHVSGLLPASWKLKEQNEGLPEKEQSCAQLQYRLLLQGLQSRWPPCEFQDGQPPSPGSQFLEMSLCFSEKLIQCPTVSFLERWRPISGWKPGRDTMDPFPFGHSKRTNRALRAVP